MNKYLKNNLNKIISIFILLQPILDLITGLCVNLLNINLTLGIIIRILFLALIMYITIFVYKKKLSLWVYISIIFYSVLYLIGIIVYNDGLVFQEIQGLVRVFYFPILLISLYELKDDIRISKMTLIATLIMYLGFIFVPMLLNVGFKSYQITKSGTLGFYNSANEISGIISLITPITFILLKGKKNLLLKGILVLMYFIVILNIGTKTPLLTLGITIGITFIYYMFNCLKKKAYKPIIYTATLILVGLVCLMMIIPKTNFYKNIEVHLDYLEVDNIFEIFTEYELVDHFIFSQRLTFMGNKHEIYKESTTYEKLFGIGYVKNNKITKMIEMDYFDIFYSHGIAGFIIFFSVYFYILYQILKEKQKITYDRTMYLTSLLLIIVLSLFTGHIITAPAVSLIVVIMILSLQQRNKKDILFATVSFDVGGIETSLINLLNQFDYNKYNVTVVLERKEGLLLNQVNENVNLVEVKVSNNKNVLIRKITNLLRKLKFTILNYNNYDFGCCYATYSLSSNKLARVSSVNTALYVHTDYTILYDKKEDFYNFFNTRNIKEFKHIIFVTNESKNNFIKCYKELNNKCKVCSTLADIKMIIKKSKEKISAKKPKEKKLLVFVGRLEDHSKKVSRAINLVKEIDDLTLWIIGDGPDRNMYEDLVKKCKLEKEITFFGMQKNPYPYMKEADYVILTSDYEGFALIYQEAIILNKPIIGTVNVSDEFLNIENEYANIVSKDEKEMVKQVKDILKKNEKPKELNYEQIQSNRFKSLEKLFNEVI